jgi:hypothetical protein
MDIYNAMVYSPFEGISIFSQAKCRVFPYGLNRELANQFHIYNTVIFSVIVCQATNPYSQHHNDLFTVILIRLVKYHRYTSLFNLGGLNQPKVFI